MTRSQGLPRTSRSDVPSPRVLGLRRERAVEDLEMLGWTGPEHTSLLWTLAAAGSPDLALNNFVRLVEALRAAEEDGGLPEPGAAHPESVAAAAAAQTGVDAGQGSGASQQDAAQADASQVEPRILAAMAADEALARAGTTPDLYREVAEQGRAAGTALADRGRAKVALLGAMYGSTTGDSAALMPHLRRLYPRAIGLLERAASVGEGGGQVSTWLGRWSPAPGRKWQESVSDVGTQAAESAARRRRRSQGRFTRNFVVQGTAAEWALCWMGEIRRRLRSAGMRTELVFFVHDEVVLHGPATEAEAVRTVVAESASAAGRLLFGPAPVDFPLTVSSVGSYADAK